ncbi:hypothetical protein BK816_06970 [Boudabousia tangfeifanii]|uniref:ABC transporter permease n=1 Tax=Boudabousia tangfeifanii TaxID=1912795 RepID=A0A1D9ML13_9ACTO|nr:ABC transporter permease [Boudabousia tangfeifanii]AOZ73061.1 hypothetical protein BK816_06970 [Boudabousia tangfeifanii]
MAISTTALLHTLIGCAIFLALTLAIQKWYGVQLGWQPLIAGLRAVIQLAALSLILHGIFDNIYLAWVFVGVMMLIASLTSMRRSKGLIYGAIAAPAGIVVSASITIIAIFAIHMLDFSVSHLIAVGGIVTGNCMSAATLTGRRFMASSKAMRGEIEGWLALGAPPQRAFLDVSRVSIREMLIPKIDQTKNTGLVTLPGAFVGALMGGAVPIEAAQFQIVVLISIMFASTLTATIQTMILSRATKLSI